MTRKAFYALAALMVGMTPALSQESVKIGFIADMTGPLAPIGTGLERGVAAARDVWNANNAKKIELVQCDSLSTGAGALSCYQRLKSSVVALSGPHLFLGLASVKGVADKVPPVIVSGAPMAGPSGDAAAGSHIFQDLPQLEDQASAALAYLKKQGRTKIALLAANDLPGNITIAGAKAYAAANGIELVRIEQFDGTAQSLAPQAENIAAAKPDGVVGSVVGPALITALRALKTANVDVPIVLNYAAMSSSLLTRAETAAGDNLFFTATRNMDPSSVTDPTVKKRLGDFDTKFQQLYNMAADFTAYVAADTVNILAQAATAPAGSSKIRETMESGTPFWGVLWPEYKYSPRSHVGATGVAAFDILRWQPAKKNWSLVQ